MNRIEIIPISRPPAAYDLIVEGGALATLPALLEERAPAHHYLVIADHNLAVLYGDELIDKLRSAGLQATLIPFAGGEERKTRQTWAELTDACLASGAGRDTVVLGFGGGVTGDIAGFVAATFLRGVPIVQIPTSLLAMLDSAVGGKTGIDTPAGKNLVGAFHNPLLVIADPLVLRTLPERELRAGLAEAVKHGAIADRSYFEWIGEARDKILAGDLDALTELVTRSVEIKAEVTARDPFETGPRMMLNFGHTIGHAIEAISEYRVPHGFAVSMGMVAAARIGELTGLTREGSADQISRLLERVGLPVSIPHEFSPSEIVALTRSDKKAREGLTRYTLLKSVGEVARGDDGEWSHLIDEPTVVDALSVSIDGNEV